MKHFLLESTYLVPAELIVTVRPAHRSYIQVGIDHGLILFAGPQASGAGGLILARADSQKTVEDYFASDPYVREGYARYRFVEFAPVLHAPLLADWVGPA